MMHKLRMVVAVILFTVITLSQTRPLNGQEAGPQSPPAKSSSTIETDIDTSTSAESTKSPLGDKQAIIRDRVGRLEDRMFELSKALKKAEPEHAAKLVKALGASRSLSVRSKMDEIVAKLTAERLSDAADQQKVVAADLEQLLQLLMEEDDKSAERKKDMDRIKAAKEALNKIIAEQEKERADALAAAAAERTADSLEVLAEKVRGLLERQRGVTAQSGKSEGDPQSASKTAGDQAAVRRDAEKLAEKLQSNESLDSPVIDPQGAPNAGPNAPKPANGEGSPQGEGADKSAQPSGESQGGSEGESSGESGEQGKPTESQESPSGGKQSESGDAGDPKNAAKQAGEMTREAAEKMESAEKGLRDGKAGSAKGDQKAAEKKLEQAAERLDAQAKAIRNKLKLDEDAKRQRETKDKTKKLAEDMKSGDEEGEGGDKAGDKSKGEKGSESGKEGGKEGGQSGGKEGGEQGGESGGQQGEQKDGQQGGQQGGEKGESQQGEQSGGEQQEQPMPGQQDIEGALPLQEDAADQLDKKKPDEAAKKQEQALQRLKQAKDQMEDVLDQMRKEQQEELLAALEARFRAMLAQQLEVNKGTQTLDGIGSANWKRSDQLELAELSRKQKWVGDQADQTMQIFVEEGTTVVFPQIIEQIRDDGREVAGRIASADVGAGVQATQAELEQAIRDLLGAVKKMQEELQQQDQQGGGGGGGNKPLLPGSAELKLLRACQLRVNSSTETLQSDKLRPEVPSTDIVSRLEKLEKRQQEVSKMAKELHESLSKAQ